MLILNTASSATCSNVIAMIPSSAPSKIAPHRTAFTLIEVLIVVVILGLLASIVLPNFTTSTTKTRETTFIRSLVSFQIATQTFQARRSDFPPQAAPGVIPEEFKSFLPAGAWSQDTPIGGQWDIDRTDAGVTFAIGVHFGSVNPPLDRLTTIDELMDDGDLTTGRFRQFGANRFYHVMAE